MQRSLWFKRRIVLFVMCMCIVLVPVGMAFALELDADGFFYKISTEADLNEFRDMVNNGSIDIHARLKNDIQLTSDWVPIGKISCWYKGVFDGQGYTIKGIVVPSENAQIYYDDAAGDVRTGAGLFCVIDTGAWICNLIIDGAKVNGERAGVIAGMSDGGSISSVVIQNSVIEASGYAGAFVGEGAIGAGSISNCFALGNVFKGSAIYVGGIMGFCDNHTIENCLSQNNSINSSGARFAGGIAGYASGYIINCASMNNNIHSSRDAGGILGRAGMHVDVRHCTVSGGAMAVEDEFACAGGIIGRCPQGAGGSIKNSLYAAGLVSGDVSIGIGGNNLSENTAAPFDSTISDDLLPTVTVLFDRIITDIKRAYTTDLAVMLLPGSGSSPIHEDWSWADQRFLELLEYGSGIPSAGGDDYYDYYLTPATNVPTAQTFIGVPSMDNSLLKMLYALQEGFGNVMCRVIVDEQIYDLVSGVRIRAAEKTNYGRIRIILDGSEYRTTIGTTAPYEIQVPRGTDLSSLYLSIDLFWSATTAPDLSIPLDFSNGAQTIKIIAQDQVASMDISVLVDTAKLASADVIALSAEIDGVPYTAALSGDEYVITTPYGVALTNVMLAMTVSEGATLDKDLSIAQDFSDGAIAYTVTAENGQNHKVAIVRVMNEAPSDETDIISNPQITIGAAVYTLANSGGSKYSVTVPNGTNLSNILLDLGLPTGATSNPALPVYLNFSNGAVPIIITAQDGVTTNMLMIEVLEAASGKTELASHNIKLNSLEYVLTNLGNSRYRVTVPYGTDLSQMLLELDLPLGATSNPETPGTFDFSNGSVTIEIIAQDGVTKESITITVFAATQTSSSGSGGGCNAIPFAMFLIPLFFGIRKHETQAEKK